MRPSLVAFVDGTECARLDPPADLGSRAWLLAVAAVQVSVAGGIVRPVLRVHVTGADAPSVIDLADRARVDLALIDGAGPPPRRPALDAIDPGGAAARLAIAVDGVPGRHAVLPRDRVGADPAPRAFGHVYSRWLRDGGHESGYDLTDFQSSARGVKFERIQSADATPPIVISYLISVS